MKRVLKAVIKYLREIVVFLERKVQEGNALNSISINTLAPIVLEKPEDLRRVQPYLDSLKQAVDADGINNIAITGSYGSGKSTILKTFQYLYPKYNYLNVSLASFRDSKEDSKEHTFENKLEISILQQIFYHVKPSIIPDSRFKRIISVSRFDIALYMVLFIVWMFSVLVLFKFKYIEKLNPIDWNFSYSVNWIAVVSTAFFCFGISLFIKSIYRLLSNSRINKVNIQGEIELGENIDKSVFNQHLEEILYFFERTDFNVVVIEDVDRFNSTDIFTKLREINILINNSKVINRPVKFIYAIKDEMFNDKNDRVKFFEFIIPVIPFINPSNASDQLAKLISNANLGGVLSADFTSDVVTFINDIDMRLLINIFQEYMIYRSILSDELTQDNLFAIIVYKNMYPDDFGELQKRKGKLHSFFSNKRNYIANIVVQHQAEMAKIDKQILLLETEASKPIKELRAVYINLLVSKLDKFHSFYVNANVSLIDAVEDKYFNTIKNSEDIEYVHYESNYHQTKLSNPKSSGVTFSSIEKVVSSSLTYDQREKILVDKSNNQSNILKAEKEKLRNTLNEIEGLSVKEIFEKVDADKYLEVFSDSYLMRNLLLNGYIDEHYDDYISLFHEVNLTKEDHTFERKIKSGQSLQFDFPISKIENLLKRLPDKYFKKEQILNYYLLEFFLKNEEKYNSKLNDFFKILSTDGDKQFQFIYGFVHSNSKDISLFIKNLCIHKPTLWQYLKDKSDLPENEIRNLVKLIFEYADKKSIAQFTNLKSLVELFSKMDDFFSFSSSFNQTNTIQTFIVDQNILFEKLDLPDKSQEQLFSAIYSKNAYILNQHNIQILIEANEKACNEDELSTSHYTTLLKLGLKDMLDYIDSNIEYYIENVMLVIKGNVKEDEKNIIDILNRDDVGLDLKTKLLRTQSATINSLSSIADNEVKQAVLGSGKLKPDWENIFDYYDAVGEQDFDEALIKYLNSQENYRVLSTEKLRSNVERGEDYIKKVSIKLIYSTNLEIGAYTSLIDSLPYHYTQLDYAKLAQERIEILISKKVLGLSVENFNGLKSKGGVLHIKMLQSFQNKFVERVSEFGIDANDWVFIFSSALITNSNKLNLLQSIDDSIIINNGNVANVVCNILPADKYVALRFEVLDAMFKANNSLMQRIRILNLHLDNLDDAQVQSLTEKLGDNYAKIFLKKHKPVFASNPQNIFLFDKLRDRGLIIRYEQVEKTKEIKVFAKY